MEKNKYFTFVDNKGFVKLIDPLKIEKAVSLLNEYEKTQLTPKQITALIEENKNLRRRIKEMEDW